MPIHTVTKRPTPVVEYKVVTGTQLVESTLNTMGLEGWYLRHVVPLVGNNKQFIFIRERNTPANM